MNEDPTMSQDTAFTTENTNESDDKFAFDEVKEETPTESQSETSPEASKDEAAELDSEEDEQKVPYSRFSKKVAENNEYREKIQFLEGQLDVLNNSRTEFTSEEDEPMPPQWIKLYGDSDIAKEAWAVQRERERELAESVVRRTLDSVRNQQEQEQNQLVENEEAIDESLSSLSESLGKRLSAKQEEEILSIVDEFSPVGSDGKYTVLYPFDKAYEIYELRNAQKGNSTRRARTAVADLTSGSSESETDSAISSSNKREGWDSWRKEI